MNIFGIDCMEIIVFNPGPIGMLAGSGVGIVRTMLCDPNNRADFTPVDVCIKALIIAAWKRALVKKLVYAENELKIE